MKRKIRLTESELHSIIEESVYNYLAENGQNEGLWNAIKATGKWASNAMSGKGTNWRQSYNMYQNNDVVNKLSKNIANLENSYNAIFQTLQQDPQTQRMFSQELNGIKTAISQMQNKVSNFSNQNQQVNNSQLSNGQSAAEANNNMLANF